MNTPLGLYRFVSARCPNTYWIVLDNNLILFEHKHIPQLSWSWTDDLSINPETEELRTLLC